MTLSMLTTLEQVRALVAAMPEFRNVYSQASIDDHRLPAALSLFPSVLLFTGPDTDPAKLVQGQKRHTYEVLMRVFCASGGDIGASAYQATAIVDAVIAMCEANVALGARVNWFKYRAQSGLVELTYNGVVYPGIDITLEVSEQSSASPTVGS